VTLVGTQHTYVYIYELIYFCMCVLGLVGGRGNVRGCWREHSIHIYICVN